MECLRLATEACDGMVGEIMDTAEQMYRWVRYRETNANVLVGGSGDESVMSAIRASAGGR